MARVRPPRRNGIREVAAAAGVSVGTVSNVINSPDLVAGSTRQRVESAMRQLAFVRNGLAHQLRAGRSATVGAVVLDLANPFFTEVNRSVEDRLAEDDCVLIVCSTDEKIDKEARYLRLLEEQGVRGILITPTDPGSERIAQIRARGLPVVLMDCPSPVPQMCSVAVDDVQGGDLAAGHLIARGHRRIAFFNGPRTIRQCADRSLGMRNALRRADLDPAHLMEVTLSGDATTEGAVAHLETVLSGPDVPTAIACVSDVVALGVLRGLRQRGIRVPDEMAVVGYDDVPFAAELYTPLTTIRQPKQQLGRAAAELLLDEADPEHVHQQIVLHPELVIRSSS
jgi:LacI family transcriptional regulator